mgnify:FL=1|jgi:hypothetical protein
MEKLAEELSKLFNVSTGTIENIIQNYPKLRGQMVIYNILNEISGLAFGVIFMILVVNAYLSYFSIMTEKRKGNSKKRFNISIVALVAAVIIILMVNILESILVPDYMFVRTILDTLN